MLNDEDRISLIHESMQDFQESPHIFKVETRRWLIQDVQRVTSGSSREFGCEFDPLRLTS